MSSGHSTLGPFNGQVAHEVGGVVIRKFGEVAFLGLPSPYLEGIVGAVGGTGDDGVVSLSGFLSHGIEADLVRVKVDVVVDDFFLVAGGQGDKRGGENQLISFHNVLIVYKMV